MVFLLVENNMECMGRQLSVGLFVYFLSFFILVVVINFLYYFFGCYSFKLCIITSPVRLFNFSSFRNSYDVTTPDGKRKIEELYRELLTMLDTTEEEMQASQSYDLEKTLDFTRAKHAIKVQN